MNDEREVDRHVEHVPPAALVRELGPQDVPDAPRSGRYGCGGGRPGSPANARRRSIRATSRDASIASAMKATPTPARSVVMPADTRVRMTANAPNPTTSPRAIAAFAYQVTGWTGDSTNARTGERAIPGRANVAPPGIRADASQVRISSSPVARTAAPITTPSARVERRRATRSAPIPIISAGHEDIARHPGRAGADRSGRGRRTGSARIRRTSSSARHRGSHGGAPRARRPPQRRPSARDAARAAR